MNPREIVQRYYEAWAGHAGDMTGVALAEDFTFRGPVASFDSADGFRAMAKQAGAAVREFTVRRQFSDGDVVCSIIDWRMGPVAELMTAAELLTVRDGEIVSGELIYDPRALLRAGDLVDLVERGYDAAVRLLARVESFEAPSPCAGWTVRQVANHLVGGLVLLTRIAEGETVPQHEFNAQATADTDNLGDDPAAALRTVADRSLAALRAPGTLDRTFPFMGGTELPGVALANICLLESVVHGWDIARGAGLGFEVDEDLVAATREFAQVTVTDESRSAGRFGPAVAAPPDASAFASLLGHLGRSAG
ncbi:TIGR03086 family metal-binding protein [Lentzea flava]|uniref:TIGR03086 family protein n=1 Tax=Lentzea flava TaxID=103732 RepID=A0ABQ2VHM6_9PSEU|nr:TIGR03086 family metal-binding protein [Lentzea flava]MCP2205098.1 TIGR03086 family protein [Lentzea flava]GGU83620.1 hypothetical protein GCM10010178_87450 [Lentzea flava]